MTKAERYKKMVEWFQVNMPVAETELHYSSPYELLVAVILSAQCTDKRINMITPSLFEAFPTPEQMSVASVDEIYTYISSVSYPNNKARNLKGMAMALVNDFGGEVPDNLDDLIKIPGVGRKTANVILSVVYGKAAMAVDTHVFRVSERIGLTTNSKSPLHTEKELVRYIPEQLIPKAHHWLILHGRYVCKARRPDCLNCGLNNICRYYQRESK
ncbi:MAG: endonuclease III [Bacteroides sp.]|nr:endonuclease III [Bacteroides sp.]